MGRGHRFGEVLRPSKPRRADGTSGAAHKRQASAATDPKIPTGRDDDRRGDESASGGNSARWTVSPLLSNILLDELDKELERRGHKFCRYADDCNIYVRTRAAGERVKA